MPEQETAAVARLAELKCNTCGGHCDNYNQCFECDHTGRRLPGLVKECPAEFHNRHFTGGIQCCSQYRCDGSRLLPVYPAEALHWLMGQESFIKLRRTKSSFYLADWFGNIGSSGPTPLLALAAAIEASEGA